MWTRAGTVGILLTLAACRDVSAADALCTRDDNCPTPYVCGSFGHCVTQTAPDAGTDGGGDAGAVCAEAAAAFEALATAASPCSITIPAFTIAALGRCDSTCSSSVDQQSLAALATCVSAVAACDPANSGPFVTATNECAATETAMTGPCQSLLPTNGQ